MSDEEKLAEEFVIKDCCTDCPAKNQSCKEKCECVVFAKRAFLAGLKAGRTELHKVSEQIPTEEKKLKWTDLVIGDIITDGFNTAMVTHINSIDDEEEHIYAGAWWISDRELENDWEKVEE